ncbi:MAG: beta-ketoacyl synthase N-terminal-like domain-containing protein [Planctomycetota bacterium]
MSRTTDLRSVILVAGFPSDSIVLTGCGWVTPFAAGSIATVLTAAPEAAGRGPSAEDRYWAVPDSRLADRPHLSKELTGNKGAWMTAVAFEHARREAGLQPNSVAPERIGLALGCALAGQLGMIEFANEVRQQTARFVSPIHFPQTVGNYVAGALARAYNLRGPNVTLSSGVASGLDALIEGCRLLRAGEADVVFAGGTDCMSDALALGLAEPGPDAPRLSEGACLFVLERAEHADRRGVAPLAAVTGACQSAPRERVDIPVSSGRVAGAPANGPSQKIGMSPFSPETGDRLVSVAGRTNLGDAIPQAENLKIPFPFIWIEHWVGQCFAALGAAAAAAALGAAAGLEVPLLDTAASIDAARRPPPSSAGGAASVSLGRIALPSPPAPINITVLADADGAHLTTLELTVPPTR